MSQIIDRQTLITEFEAYMKRSFPADRQDTFLQLTHDRIFRDSRLQQNILKVSLTPAQIMPLPDDFIDIREISYERGKRRVVLTAVGRHRLAVFASQTGFPVVYSLIGEEIEVAPNNLPGSFTMYYWQKLPPLVATNSTNVILTEAPYLYLYGMMIEGAVFIQDTDARGLAVQTYEAEVSRLNGQADRSRFGEAPVIGVG